MKFVEWLTNHLNLIAWPTVVLFAWKLSAVLKSYKYRFENAEKTVQLIATNHLPHVQAELEGINSKLESGFNRVADGLGNLRDILLVMNNKD